MTSQKDQGAPLAQLDVMSQILGRLATIEVILLNARDVSGQWVLTAEQKDAIRAWVPRTLKTR